MKIGCSELGGIVILEFFGLLQMSSSRFLFKKTLKKYLVSLFFPIQSLSFSSKASGTKERGSKKKSLPRCIIGHQALRALANRQTRDGDLSYTKPKHPLGGWS